MLHGVRPMMPLHFVNRAAVRTVVCLAIAVAARPTGVSTQDLPGRAPSPLLEVLRETGNTRDGVPVYGSHPDAAHYVTALSRGFSGRLLRLYALEQRYLQATRGIAPEPAYLLLSNHMGGFPRFGFFLGDRDKRTAGYVDLAGPRGRVRVEHRIGGLFGAMDQIFPHELGHVIVVQLAGEPKRGGSNQMHAIGVRTDPNNAFSEGFAEHLQVMAIDDPDALPETRALLRDDFFERRAAMQLREYAQELTARWPATGRRLAAFPMWFSATEQALRYYAVKANAFARQPRIPDRLFRRDPYAAYLLENILPGRPSDPPKNTAQLASTEGFVAALFVRWVTDPQLQATRRDAAFYAPWGVTADGVTALENVYLKLFHSLAVSHAGDVHEAIAGYEACFPDEAAALDRVVRSVALRQSFEPAPAIWLANGDFAIGTTVFDQFRSLPRVHTFDLNAASVGDLVAVPGVDRQLAEAIRRRAPYASVEGLRVVKGMDASLMRRFRALRQRWTTMRDNPVEEESSLSQSLPTLLRPYLVRLAVLLALAGALGAAAYRLAVPRGWPRAVINGLAAASVGFLLEAALDLPAGVGAVLGPVLLFGVPAALYCMLFPARTRRCVSARRHHGDPPTRWRLAVAVLFAWTLGSLPLIILMTPHF